MAVPSTREEFKEYCLRKLGKPVINIDVADSQVEDRVDEALSLFHMHHYDGSEKVYLAHEITSSDKSNRYITLDDLWLDVVTVHGNGGSLIEGTGVWSFKYQFAFEQLQNQAYFDTREIYFREYYYSMISSVMDTQPRVRFKKHNDKLYIDGDWNNYVEGTYVFIEGYKKIDPETHTDIWGDRWLQNYATALIQKNWGDQLSKFEGVQLAGGTILNGSLIRDDALQNIDKLEEELEQRYSMPPEDMIG